MERYSSTVNCWNWAKFVHFGWIVDVVVDMRARATTTSARNKYKRDTDEIRRFGESSEPRRRLLRR